MSYYPHSVIVKSRANSTGRDAKGNPLPADVDTDNMFAGRFELSNSNAFIVGEGGKHIEYKGIVYLPIPEGLVLLGAQVEVWQGDKLKAKGSVLQYSEGMFNARIWL